MQLPANGLLARAEVAPPGFVNLHLDLAYVARQVDAILLAGDSFGNVTLAAEDSRAAWRYAVLDSIVQDVRYGARALGPTLAGLVFAHAGSDWVFGIAVATTLAGSIGGAATGAKRSEWIWYSMSYFSEAPRHEGTEARRHEGRSRNAKTPKSRNAQTSNPGQVPEGNNWEEHFCFDL